MNDNELPQYSTLTRPSVSVSPTLGSAVSRVHVSSLENSKGRPWVSLIVTSRAANSALPPFFMEGDVISGRVELDLEKPETAKAVIISVQAGTTAVGQEELLFLDIRKELWTPSVSHNTATSPKGKAPSSAKLKGQYSWPFSITLPTEVPVSESRTKLGTFRLPPSFSERASPAYIDYRLVVTIKRPALKVNQTLTRNFGYLPATTPDPPSALRQLAYREGSPLVGPDADPAGWKVLPPVKINGLLFGTRNIEVTCTLALATPLCYSIGSPLPLLITFRGEDEQALDLLSTPTSISLHLVRSLATGSDAIDEGVQRRSNNFFLESVGQAFFWPSDEGAPEAGKRVLHGEVEVVKATKPSFTFPRFTVRYNLDLMSFDAPGFVSSTTHSSEPLLSEKVMIATKQVPGVTPHSYAPPGYEKAHGGDYNKSMGLFVWVSLSCLAFFEFILSVNSVIIMQGRVVAFRAIV